MPASIYFYQVKNGEDGQQYEQIEEKDDCGQRQRLQIDCPQHLLVSEDDEIPVRKALHRRDVEFVIYASVIHVHEITAMRKDQRTKRMIIVALVEKVLALLRLGGLEKHFPGIILILVSGIIAATINDAIPEALGNDRIHEREHIRHNGREAVIYFPCFFLSLVISFLLIAISQL